MSHNRIAFVDSTLRDGQETLLGGRLRVELVLPILETLDGVGFQSIEAWGGGTFQTSLSRLHENPWERLRVLRKHLKRTPIQMLLRGRFLVGDRPFSPGFVQRFLKHSYELGVEVVRLVDPLNNFQSLSNVANLAKHLGFRTEGSVLCSQWSSDSKRFSNSLERIDLSCFDSLGLFDPFGTLSSGGAGKLTSLLIEKGATSSFVHIHSLDGSAVAVAMKALERGASVVDTCFSAFEGNRSFPSVESMLRNLEGGHFTSNLNIRAMIEVSNFFEILFQEYFARIPSVMLPQTPIEEAIQRIRPTSPAPFQDRRPRESSSIENSMSAELANIIVELRLPGLVAPLSEILVRQAQLNLKSSKRYEKITNEFLEMIRGGFGKVTVPNRLLEYTGSEYEGRGIMNKFEDRSVLPPGIVRLREEDYMSFRIFSQEWSDMIKARENHPGHLKRVVAASLAALIEEQTIAKAPQQVAEPQSSRNQRNRWRDSVRRVEEYLPKARGFVEEPF